MPTNELQKGLLRLPLFLRRLAAVVREAQNDGSAKSPSLNQEAAVEDAIFSLILALALFLLRLFLHRALFPYIFSRYSRRVRSKLSENLYYATYYTLAFGYYMLAVRPSVKWSVDLFSNESNVVLSLMDPIPPPMVRVERVYYYQAAGFYLSASTFLVLFDGRRSDFFELILHHTVTIGLVTMSYLYGYVRAGILILALHDVGDIFLYSAKLVHYLGFAGMDTALFAVFAVTFFVTRLIMYPRLVHGVAVETLQTVVLHPSLNGWAHHFATYLWHYVFFVVFLGTLQVLHCFWFSLVLKMIHREVFLGKKISDEGDIRSDGEDDDLSDEDTDLRIPECDEDAVRAGLEREKMT